MAATLTPPTATAPHRTGDSPGSGSAQASPGRHTSPRLVLGAALLGFFVIGLDASAVNVALPAIGHGLGGSTVGLQWIVDAYTLMFAALLLSAGAFSDRFGASRAFAAGLAVFTLASAACGLAPSLGLLIGARLVQGSAAAVVLPSSLALVRQAFPDPAARARAIALWTVGGALATALGPIVGGALTSAVSWRAIFYLNLPVGAAVLAILVRSARSPRRAAALDLPGQAAAVLGLGALTFGVIEGGASGFTRPATVVSLLVAALAMAAFVLTERRSADPMVPLGLFRDRVVAISVAIGFTINAAFYGLVFVLGLYFQDVLGMSAFRAGLMFLPMSALIGVANMASARAAGRFGPRAPMIAGQIFCALALLLIAAFGTGVPHLVLALMLVPIGVGLGFTVPSLTAVMMGGIAPERAGMAGGVLNSARQTGGALAVAAFGALVAQRSAFLTGLHVSLLVSAALLLATAGAASLLPRRITNR
jgi:MFS transporter, DHA2 family, methylenomycin A resistance protein